MSNLESLETQIDLNRISGWPDLTDRDKLFGIKYVESYSMKEACDHFELSTSRGFVLVREPLLAAFINDLQENMNVRSVICRDFVSLQFLKLMPKLLGEEIVDFVTKDGGTFQARKFHATESVALLREIAKSTDFFRTEEGNNSSDVELLTKTMLEIVNKLPD